MAIGWCSPCQQHHWKVVGVGFTSSSQEHLKSQFTLVLFGCFLQPSSTSALFKSGIIVQLYHCWPRVLLLLLTGVLFILHWLFSLQGYALYGSSWTEWFEMDVSTQTPLLRAGADLVSSPLNFPWTLWSGMSQASGWGWAVDAEPWGMISSACQPCSWRASGWGSLIKACVN